MVQSNGLKLMNVMPALTVIMSQSRHRDISCAAGPWNRVLVEAAVMLDEEARPRVIIDETGHVKVVSGAIVEHDSRLGRFAHVLPDTTRATNADVEDAAWNGAGAGQVLTPPV